MFHIRRQSIDLTGRMRCGGRFRDSLLGRVFSTTTGATRSIRRRRPTTSRLGTKTSSTSDDDEVNTKFVTQVSNMMESVSGFVATDKDGREMTMDEYLKFATLSPWVPCPDPVARRCFDIAKAGPNDVSHAFQQNNDVTIVVHCCYHKSQLTGKQNVFYIQDSLRVGFR